MAVRMSDSATALSSLLTKSNVSTRRSIRASAVSAIGLVGPVGHARELDAARIEQDADIVVESGLGHQLAVRHDGRAIDEADEVRQAQPIRSLLERERQRQGRRRLPVLLGARVEPHEVGDGLDVFEQRVVAALLDDLDLDGPAVPRLHLVEAGGDDEAAAPVKPTVRGDERVLDLVDDALRVGEAQLDGGPLVARRESALVVHGADPEAR